MLGADFWATFTTATARQFSPAVCHDILDFCARVLAILAMHPSVAESSDDRTGGFFGRFAHRDGLRRALWINEDGVISRDRKQEQASAGPELYDLSTDPGEKRNVAADHPDVVNRLRDEAAKCEAEITANKRPPGTLSDNK